MIISNLKRKIESKRFSKKTYWKFLVLLKDIIWFFYYSILYKIMNWPEVIIDKIMNWPEVVFDRVYKEKKWGDKGGFFSGEGSLPKNTLNYRNYVEKFIKENNIKKVLDLGCGDFRVGKLINWNNAEYIGADVVKSLIYRNNKLYSNKKIKFIKKNIIVNKLPDADLCLIRQVLQHLSNKDIKKIIKKIIKYRYILVTDSISINPKKRLNLDIPRGRNRKYGLYLELPPFNQKSKIVLSYFEKNKKYILRTILLENKRIK